MPSLIKTPTLSVDVLGIPEHLPYSGGDKMKYYVIRGINRKFKTRTAAIHYMFNKMPAKTQLLYEIEKDKHDIEYVCDNMQRFSIIRLVK